MKPRSVTSRVFIHIFGKYDVGTKTLPLKMKFCCVRNSNNYNRTTINRGRDTPGHWYSSPLRKMSHWNDKWRYGLKRRIYRNQRVKRNDCKSLNRKKRNLIPKRAWYNVYTYNNILYSCELLYIVNAASVYYSHNKHTVNEILYLLLNYYIKHII